MRTPRAGELLAQHLIDCPSCGHALAVHIAFEQNEPVLVRAVCASGCADDDVARVAVVNALYGDPASDPAGPFMAER